MIYRLDVPIDWKNPKTDYDKEVYQEITQVKNKYFGDKTVKSLTLVYPKGKPKQDEGGYIQPRMIPISFRSSDGVWRYSNGKRRPDGKYVDSAMHVSYKTVFHEKDLELIWFLLNRSSYLNKYVFFDNPEEDAKKEVDEASRYVDIEFMILGKKSPIANNEQLIREIASVFGVRDVEKMGINQVKKALLEEVKKGEEMGDKYVNFKKFDELVDGENAREAAFAAREAIANGEVGYHGGAWYLMEGRDFAEKLCNIDGKERAYKEQALINEVVNNAIVRDKLYTGIGKTVGWTVEKLRDLDRPTLLRKVKDETGESLPNNATKEDAVKTLCGFYKIDYTEK